MSAKFLNINYFSAARGCELTTFYLVRNGVTRSDGESRYLGQREEDLTEEGRQQARNLAELLRNEPFDVIYTSQLRRARDTASEIALHHPGKGPLSDPRLNELHMGIFDGLLPDEARRSFQEEYAAREANKFGFRVPGGESYRMLIERVAPFVRDMGEEYPDGNVCVVGHRELNKGLLRCLAPDYIKQEDVLHLEIPPDVFIHVVPTKLPLITSNIRVLKQN